MLSEQTLTALPSSCASTKLFRNYSRCHEVTMRRGSKRTLERKRYVHTRL